MQMAAFLVNLKLRGETPAVVAKCCEVLQRHAVHVHAGDVVDIVGTGGDGLDTFNVSTCAGVVVAACGVRVAKHGNRSSSSSCGSADVLEALGAKLDLHADDATAIINACGFCFMFAQKFQPAMRHVARTRREIGTRTVFNLLGPLSNPAKPKAILAGVYSSALGSLLAETFKLQGMPRAMVVCGREGLDEISPSGPTDVWLLQDGQIVQQTLEPAECGVPVHPIEAMRGGDPNHNAGIFTSVMRNEPSPYLDWVLLNAGALLFVCGQVASIRDGVERARSAISSGAAAKVLDTFITMSRDATALDNIAAAI